MAGPLFILLGGNEMQQSTDSRFRYSSHQPYIFDNSEGSFEKIRSRRAGAMPVASHLRSKRSAHKTWRSRQASRRVARLRAGMSRRRYFRYAEL